MNDTQLREWLELCEKATPGPWFTILTIDSIVSFNKEPFIKICVLDELDYLPDNFDFISISRTGWPKTIRELIRARELFEKIKKQFNIMKAIEYQDLAEEIEQYLSGTPLKGGNE